VIRILHASESLPYDLLSQDINEMRPLSYGGERGCLGRILTMFVGQYRILETLELMNSEDLILFYASHGSFPVLGVMVRLGVVIKTANQLPHYSAISFA